MWESSFLLVSDENTVKGAPPPIEKGKLAYGIR